MSYTLMEEKNLIRKSMVKAQPGRKNEQIVSRKSEMPAYVLKNSRQKHAWEESRQKNTGEGSRGQTYPQISSGVVQMMRKRVYRAGENENDEVSSEDIFYDDTDGQYYTEMQKENVQPGQKVDGGDRDRLASHLREKGNRGTVQNILYLVDIGEKFAKYEDVDWRADATEVVFYNKSSYVYTVGHECNPITIRLYAEGDMRHAQELADGFLNDPSPEDGELPRYQRLIGLSEHSEQTGIAAGIAEKIIIKATEYRARAEVSDTYRQEIIRQGLPKKNLETSFGGRTGDMARESKRDRKGRPNRQYDLIQATFFWIPGERSKASFDKLKAFYINRYDDLKESGRIRSILSIEVSKDAGKSMEQANCYSVVAAALQSDTELRKKYDMKMQELKDAHGSAQKYSDALIDIGLNRTGGDGFRHTRTASTDEVRSKGDIIVEGIRKQQPSGENMEYTKEEEQKPVMPDEDRAAEEDLGSDDTQLQDNKVPDESTSTEGKLKEEDVKAEAEQIIEQTYDMAKLPPSWKRIIAEEVVDMLVLAAGAVLNKMLLDYFYKRL